MEFDHLLRGAEALGLTGKQAQTFAAVDGLTKDQSDALGNLSLLPAFNKCYTTIEKCSEFKSWLTSSHPEEKVPVLWEAKEPLSMLFDLLNFFFGQATGQNAILLFN